MTVVEEFDYLCRLCAEKTGILMRFPIFETGEQIRDIAKKIVACLPPLQVSMTDQLPKAICEDCAYKLDQLFDFRAKCLQTENMFVEMLKQIEKDNEMPIDPLDMPEIANNLNEMRNDMESMERMQNHMNSVSSNSEDGIHSIHAMDSMDLTGVEQVVIHEDIGHQGNDIEVTGIDCLDGETVRMVSNHQISLHLGENMTVVENLAVGETLDQLEINYVTLMPDEQSQAQMVQYCENVKYESVLTKDDYQTMQNGMKSTSPVIDNGVPNTYSVVTAETENEVDETGGNEDLSVPKVDSVPSTSQIIIENDKIVQEYTESTKDSLLESLLCNFNLDDMGVHWYICPFCSEASSQENNFVSHYQQHFCSCTCNRYFTNVEMLNLHKQQCNVNEEETSAISKEKKKKKEPNEPKKQPAVRQKWSPKICTQCGKQYRTPYKLKEHMNTHTGKKPFQCDLCEKAFRSKIGLAQHTATHTGQFDYSCSTCGKGFQCKSYLTVHQRVHSNLKPYPCTTCGQNFKTKQSLLDHENRHLGVKPYVCETCGRSFITKGLCKSHQKIHSGTDNRQYPCGICNKMFVSKSYLNTHLRIHTGEKPYLCEVCGKGFLTRVDLKIHSTMHTGEKKFKCDVCGKAFARRAALRCHCRTHSGERPYKCDVCGKTFTQFSPMAIHRRGHTGQRPYECEECGKCFVSRSTMMSHKKKHKSVTAVAPPKEEEIKVTQEFFKEEEQIITP